MQLANSKKKFSLLLLTKLCFIVLVANTFSCNSKYAKTAQNKGKLTFFYRDSCLVNDSLGKSWNGVIEAGDGHSGKNCAFTDAQNPYGLGFRKKVDSSFKNKNIRLIVEGWIKAEVPENAGMIAIQIKNGDSSLYWNSLNLNDKKINSDWTFVSDTFNIARSLMIDENEINTFMWNTDGKGKVRGDDFYIKIIEWEMPSFVPEIETIDEANFSKQLFKGDFYSILYNKESGTLAIGDEEGNPLSKTLVYHEEIKTNDGNITRETIRNFEALITNDSCLSLKIKSKFFETEFILYCSSNEPELKAEARFKSLSAATVQRQSLIIPYMEDVDEVYRNNTLIDTTDFQREYWLNKEGCKIGKNKKSIIVYGNNQLSSTQLSTEKKILVLNFDYSLDHPLMQFPLRKDDKKGVKHDISANHYTANETRTNKFKLFIGSNIQTVPIMMQHPSGNLSTFIFTEHADYTDMQTSYAVYYGSSKIKQYSKASGGFCKYGIPVTKSIFYHNPEHFNNKEFNGAFTTEMLAWKGNSEYQKFIKELYDHGNEICLHTPDYATTKREYMEEALSAFAKEFKSVSWIDHGYDNGVADNREDFVCDGLMKSSENYSLDLWEEYGINYFWNCYNEDSAIYGQLNFSNRLKNPYFGLGDIFPSPDFWKNRASGNSAISWKTHVMMDFKDDNNWNYYFDNTVLGDMVQNRQVLITHLYPARVDSVTSFYNKNNDGSFSVNENFDRFLQRIAKLRNDKKLNITTLADYLNYRTMLENIDYVVTPEGFISLTNKNDKDVKGFTLFTTKKFSSPENLTFKNAPGGGYLYTIDLQAGKKLLMEYQ